MVKSGEVKNNLSELEQVFTSYQNNIDNLSGNWQGTSFDSITSKCDSFVSEFKGAISSQMNSYASACDAYEEYIQYKRERQSVLNQYNSSSDEEKGVYVSQLNDLDRRMNSARARIEDYLSSAASVSLDASSSSGTVSGGGSTTSAKGSLTSAQVEAVLSAAESQLGVQYWSLHYGPKGSDEEGFGCAMFVSYCYNEVLFNGARGDEDGTEGFIGSTYEYWGNVTNDGYNAYNKGFIEVSEDAAQPGDVVCYITEGTDPYESVENCPHVALYVGDGQIIGSCPKGVVGGDVSSQAYGTVPHYIHYVGTDDESNE